MEGCVLSGGFMRRIFSFLMVMMVALMLSHGAYAVEREGGSAKEDPNAPHPEFAYIKMDPINLPIITSKGLTQQVSLMVSVEVGWDEKEKVAEYKPRLADAYIQDLYGAIGAGYALMQGSVVDVVQIKQRLISVTDKVLGPDLKAHGVLLSVIQQRAM